jgi:DNA-binding HxlR family transcriptional regulator
MKKHTVDKRSPLRIAGCELNERCPVVRAVRALEGKWKLYIIYHLMSGTMRFGELRRAIPGVTQQMLTMQLRELEADGIVRRKVFPEVPPKVEYSLTSLGLELRTITEGLTAWGLKLVA